MSEQQQTVGSERAKPLPDRAAWPRDPYKGLNYFSAVDRPLFGQRETEIFDVVALLSSFDTRALLLHGGTGTGKSSFLRAGLCPYLQRLPVESGREFFFLSGMLSGESNDPLLIRATDDPVGRIYEVLRKAGESQSSTLSEKVRQTLRERLAQDIPHNRLKAIPAILDALRAITAPPQRGTFVLLVDQAEEVLTLPATADAENRRQAFFTLIEQICFRLRSMDLRLIVALRTEYYGRFCSFFRIRPTTTLSPNTEIGAGLFDYLLRPLGAGDIAAAIRQPTSNEPRDDGLPPPRSVYGFSYQGKLPETIAADLLSQSGEASTLPAMQIVCKQLYERVVVKEGRPEITENDYKAFGRAEGAIDAFLERALQEAAKEAKLPPLGETDIDTWALVLWHVVGRAEGGTVQTLIASEGDLLKRAESRGIAEGAARAMLIQMVDPRLRLLRLAGGEGGKTAYSLGHDSLGPSVLRRSAQATVRIEERKGFDKRVRQARLRLSAAAAIVLGFLAAGSTYYALKIRPVQDKVDALTNYAAREGSSDFRLRLLLLAAALRGADSWPGSQFVSIERPKEVIRDVLLRSPVFGGTFEAAAWSSDGNRVVRFADGKLIVHDLSTGKDDEGAPLPRDSAGPPGPNAPPSVGLVKNAGKEELVAFDTGTARLFAGPPNSTLVDTGFVPPPLEAGYFVPRADIFKDRARIFFMHFDRNAVTQMNVLQLWEIKKGAKPASTGIVPLDWDPFAQQAFRQPIIAEDCNTYAFLSRDDDGDGYALRLGQVGKKIERSERFYRADSTAGARALVTGAIAIARKCGSIFALTRDDESTSLHIVSLKQDQPKPNSARRSIPLGSLADDANITLPTSAQVQPMLAAAPLGGIPGWRVGWPTTSGLVIVDIMEAEPAERALRTRDTMLTGVPSTFVWGSLSLSPDATKVLLLQQQTFSGPIQVRAFDLDFDARRKQLEELTTREALVQEACKIAALQDGDGNNPPRIPDRSAWFPNGDAPQPCVEVK